MSAATCARAKLAHSLALLINIGERLNIVGNYVLPCKDFELLDEFRNDGLIVDPHQVRKRLAERRSCLLQVVVRNNRKQVVNLMRADVVSDRVQPAVVAIDAGEVALHVVPVAVRVPLHSNIVVMKKRDSDEPCRKHKNRSKVSVEHRDDAAPQSHDKQGGDPRAVGAKGHGHVQELSLEEAIARVEVACWSGFVAKGEVVEPRQP
mmetsp:Transcript_6983/g.21259  ORF Transcript_6983/g.21259 Transcript_6983/m.21259 type:complete len:206 (+) Transcript_6983:62-679(+)